MMLIGVGWVAGEVLGCTAPLVGGSADAIVFVADGRFHLEAIMIANPDIPAFRCLCPLPRCAFVFLHHHPLLLRLLLLFVMIRSKLVVPDPNQLSLI